MKLTEHFTWDEVEDSPTALRLGIDNALPALLVTNAEYTAQQMEQIRALLGNKPIKINSWYRSIKLNRRLGSSDKSAHCKALAVDFTCPGYGGPLVIAKALQNSAIPYDQLIYEGTWVHIGFAAPGQKPRREALTAIFHNGDVRYVPGIGTVEGARK